MDLDHALAAHADWKVKLRVALASKQRLDAASIASDCQCDFGRWLHGDGKRAHGASQNFKSCVESHAEFHRCAGLVAQKINAADYAGAELELGAGNAFSKASTIVAVAVRRLKMEMLTPP